MIPTIVETYLRERHPRFEHHTHEGSAMTAQDLAAAEHVSGHRVAKPVVVRLGGRLALAVVAAADKLRLGILEEATGEHAELVSESEFRDTFGPCETGAEPPLSIFDVPILADEKLLQTRRLLMPGGTHRDAIMLETKDWVSAEKVQPIANLGAPLH
jgi:Ala-tRNA(Pro) deacylase